MVAVALLAAARVRLMARLALADPTAAATISSPTDAVINAEPVAAAASVMETAETAASVAVPVDEAASVANSARDADSVAEAVDVTARTKATERTNAAAPLADALAALPTERTADAAPEADAEAIRATVRTNDAAAVLVAVKAWLNVTAPAAGTSASAQLTAPPRRFAAVPPDAEVTNRNRRSFQSVTDAMLGVQL